MNILKLLTKSGRRAIARELIEKHLTPDNIAAYAVAGVNNLLGRVNDKDRLGAVALNVERAAALCAKVSGAIKDGTVTPEEAAEVASEVSLLCEGVVTRAAVDKLIGEVLNYVP